MNKDLDLLLIRLVKATPILYDKSKFSDYNEREVAWQKIGDKLHRPALECKERWMSMREFFRCTTLKTIVNKSNGQTTTRKPYKYHKELLFLVAHYKNGIVNIEDLENKVKDDEEDDDFPVTFHIDGPDILNDVDELRDDANDTKNDEAINYVDDLKDDDDDAFNDVDNLKDEDDSETKEDHIKTDNFSEDSTGDLEQLEENFESMVSQAKSHPRKRKKAVNIGSKSIRVKNKIVELNPSNTTDNFLIDIRAKMKKLSRSKVDKVKSKIYSIISQYD